MGIFKEDLINFGNLIDTEVEVKLTPQDFKKVFPDLDFEFTEGLAKIKGKKKGLLFKRGFEFRGAQDEQRVYNEREFETLDMGVYLKIISPQGIEELEKRGMKREGEHLKLSVFEVLKKSDTYKDIPDAFKERLIVKRYRIREGALSIFITVTK